MHSEGQSSVTSRSRPQHCGQILSWTAGQKRFSRRVWQMAQDIIFVASFPTAGETSLSGQFRGLETVRLGSLMGLAGRRFPRFAPNRRENLLLAVFSHATISTRASGKPLLRRYKLGYAEARISAQPVKKKPNLGAMATLRAQRERFRESMPAMAAARDRLRQSPLRTAVVLSGGGARGAYEAGVLLAFQDAELPTHILAATSVGSINAASYAAHSATFVGNAEPMVEAWSQITPPAMGIDWSRYVFMLAGLVAASVGFGNWAEEWFSSKGVYLHLANAQR